MTSISGSIESKNARQGVEIKDYQQSFSSTLPRLFPNSSPRIIKNNQADVNESESFQDVGLFSEDRFKLVPNLQVENRDFGGTGIESKNETFFQEKTENQALSGSVENSDGRVLILGSTSKISKNILGKTQMVGIKSSLASNFDSGETPTKIEQTLPINKKISDSKTTPFLESQKETQNISNVKFLENQGVTNHFPFNDVDKNQRLKEELNENDFVTVLSVSSESYGYYDTDSKSSTAGFVSRENFNGTDSLSFIDRQSFTSSFAPRLNLDTSLRILSKENIGFADSGGPLSKSPFDDNRTVTGNQTFYPGNYFTNPTGSIPKIADISVTAGPLLSQRGIKTISDDITPAGFSENLSKEDLLLADGTYAKSVIKISINAVSQSSEMAGASTVVTGANLAYAGRCHSALVDAANSSLGYSAFGAASLFLSSALRDTDEFSNTLGTANKATGIAGTGFLYYSPARKAWIEKRANFSTSLFTNTRAQDRNNGFNCIEINTDLYDTSSNEVYPVVNNRDIAKEVFVPSLMTPSTRTWWSTKLQISGSENILAQFSASPQVAYFLPYKEHLERIGYQNIGTPTVAYGAPFAEKYHAFDQETIKLRDYIDRPFRLRKVLIKVPVEVQRRHDFIDDADLPQHVQGSSWAENVTARKDIDNYVFFLYRQRRLGNNIAPTDDILDRQTSTRFLIASSSLCVYNSSSFGRSHYDGFMDDFGIGTPVISGNLGRGFGSTDDPATYLDGLISFVTGNNQDPFLFQNLTYVTGPLHNPSVAINAGLTDFTQTERYFGKGKVCLTMYPAVVEGGYHVPTLIHVTSSTGYLSTSFYSREGGGFGNNADNANRLFNRYPYTGSYVNPFLLSFSPPATTVMQNFWFGGTRQPSFDPTQEIKPFISFKRNDPFFATPESLQFREDYTSPLFDVEIARVGLSIFDSLAEPFETPFSLVSDSRSVPNTLPPNPKPVSAGVIRRSNLISFQSIAEETSVPAANNAVFTIGDLSGSSVSDIVMSFTVGYCPTTAGGVKQEIRDYILLPEDELVLGLDAGVTPIPDVTPMQGIPMPDLQGDYIPVPASTKSTGNNIVLQNIPEQIEGESLQNTRPGPKRKINQPPEPVQNQTRTPGGSPLVRETPKIRKNNQAKESTDFLAPSTARQDLSSGFTNSGGGGGVPCSIYLEDSFDEGFQIVGFKGKQKGFFIEDFLTKIDPINPGAPARRKSQQPFINQVLKDRIGHYSGNSYLRILHGEAEIILMGEYVVDDLGKNLNRNSFSSEISQVIGNDFSFDNYDVEEDESYRGTYLADFVTGSIFDGTRGIDFDRAIRSSQVNSNFTRFVRVTSPEEVIYDFYFSGSNESPSSAFRNNPVPPGFVSNPLQNVLGGVSISSGSFFRGRAAFKIKPAIPVSARLNPRHHGFRSDIVEGTENTRLYNIQNPDSRNTLSSPVRVNFVFENQVIRPVTATRTSNQNISPTSEVNTPYVDGEAVSRPPLENELITLE